MNRDQQIWQAALTLAHNLCVQASDRYNADDETDHAQAAQKCAHRVRECLDASVMEETLAEAGIEPLRLQCWDANNAENHTHQDAGPSSAP